MKKLSSLFALAVAIAVVACTDKGGNGSEASLSVNSRSLTFEATGNSSQEIIVTANNVEWTYTVPSSAQEWLSATREGDKLTVSATDNSSDQQRSATITVKAENNIEVSPIGVSVLQKEGAGIQEYELTVAPASLSFAGEEAPAQSVTVTVSDPALGWTAAPEQGAVWIHASVEGSQISVTVDDNPNTTPRAAMLIVTPDKEGVSSKSVRVEQKGKIVLPSLEVTPTELSFDFRGDMEQILTVKAVEVVWKSVTSDEEGNEVPWIHTTDIEANQAVAVSVDRNETLEPRSGYVVVKSGVESVPDVRISVTQEAGVSSFSNLTESVEVTDMEPAGGLWCHISPLQMWDTKTPCTEWTIEMWGSGVTRTSQYEAIYTGSGTRFKFSIFSERILYNYDEEFALPVGEYNVVHYDTTSLLEMDPFTVEQGEDSNNLAYPSGSWYCWMEDGEYTKYAPLMEGKLIVARNEADEYTFTFDFKDDAGYSITGQCVSPITYMNVSFFKEDQPDPEPNPNPEPDPDPGFPTE